MADVCSTLLLVAVRRRVHVVHQHDTRRTLNERRRVSSTDRHASSHRLRHACTRCGHAGATGRRTRRRAVWLVDVAARWCVRGPYARAR